MKSFKRLGANPADVVAPRYSSDDLAFVVLTRWERTCEIPFQCPEKHDQDNGRHVNGEASPEHELVNQAEHSQDKADQRRDEPPKSSKGRIFPEAGR